MGELPEFRRRAERLCRWPVLLAWMALIFALSSIPNEVVNVAPQRIPFDKMAHGSEYAVLGFLLFGIGRASARGASAGVLLAVAAVAVATLYGASDEFHQRFVPGRDPDLHDLAADAIGSAVGALVGAFTLRRPQV
jgi:VanZ family protein